MLFFFSPEKLTPLILLKEVYALFRSQNAEDSNHCKLVFATATFSLKPILEYRGEVVTSRFLGCHGFWISTNRGPADMTENSKKVDMHNFPVHD